MDDERWMQIALEEAWQATLHADVPVGAVAVRDGEAIARAHNRREVDQDPTAHAEILALRQAAAVVGHWRLEGVTLYCTLEPCSMCAGAMLLARLPRLVVAAIDPKAGAAGSVIDLLDHPQLNHRVDVQSGVLSSQAADLLVSFFTSLRKEGPK